MFLKKINQFRALLLLLIYPTIAHASFIETTQGVAVINDSTATFYNPAALTLLKNPQIIPLVTYARFQTKFTGQSTNIVTTNMISGVAQSNSYYYSPTLYFGIPINKFTIGFGAIANFANRNPEDNSILRYIQSSNSIQDYNFVTSAGVKINQYIALGAGLIFSKLSFNLDPILGFPGSNIPDSQSHNQSSANGLGANIGLLFTPREGTLIGFDYRSATNYEENGKSTLKNPTALVSNNYNFELHSPARSILSISQTLTSTIGVITTIQRTQWSIIKNINVNNFVALNGATPIIINTRAIPYYLRDTWMLTLGGNYKFKPNWVVRAAATYSQSPDNSSYQLSTGDNFLLGISLSYILNKIMQIDASYAHAFVSSKQNNITGMRYNILGSNKSSRDVVALKLTFNI